MADVVELRPVTPENYKACLALKVRPDQEGYVAPNVDSLALAYVYPDAEAKVVYHRDEPVGFVLFHPIDEERPSDGHSIVRFMVDRGAQGQGIGRRALEASLDWIARERRVDVVQLSVEPENARARSFYRAAGFEETGEIDEGEIVLRRTLP
ncbi:GNAT family N-acetyltransferase [Streptomyces sp. NPDC056544]|uniref:GNAT family N-acetyltransferase n=1 Tax=unclassified Streptomyces TaxID=2593676 RepID=UPI0036ACCF8E